MRSGNKLKFLRYLLVATSSLASLSGEVYAANGVSRLGNSFLGNDDWGLGRGLQNGDNLRIGQHNSTLRYDGNQLDFAAVPQLQGPNRAIPNVQMQKIQLNDLDLNGRDNSLIRLMAVELSHHNIIDTSGQNKKVKIEFNKFNYFENDGTFTNAASIFKINGNDISALGDIYFGTSNSIQQQGMIMSGSRDGKVIFDSAVTYTGNIYSRGDWEQDKNGSVIINNNVTFTNKIGFNPNSNAIAEISIIQVEDQKALTAKANIYTNDQGGGIELTGADAELIVNSTNNPVLIRSNINTMGLTGDQDGILRITGANQTRIEGIIASEDTRIKTINMNGNSNITFTKEIYAKKIEIDQNTVVFEDDVDMFTRQFAMGKARAQQNITDRGTLEFIGDGIVKVAGGKNIFGDIRTRVGGVGTVIYEGNRQLQEQIGAGNNAKLKSIQFSTAGANIQLSTNNIHAMNLSLLDAGQTLTVDDNISFAGKIIGRGTVNFAGRSTVAQIGEINARVARVRAGIGNLDFNQPIYADIVEINGNSPVRIIDRTLSTNHILLNHQHAQVTVVNGFAAPVTILAAVSGHGHVIFAANGNVGAIGQNGTPVGTTEFQNNAQHNLNNDIYTNNIIFDNGVFTPQNQNIRIIVPQRGINNIPAGWQYVQDALITNARAQQLVQPPVNQNQQPIQLVNQNQQPELEPEIVDNQRQELIQNEQNEPQQLELEVNNDRPVLQQQPLEVVANQPQELVINEQNHQQENRIIDIEQPAPQVHYTQIDAEVQQQRVVQIKESLIQATSTIIDTNSNVVHQDTATKILVSQLTAPVIQNHKNVEDTIRQLNNMGVTFNKTETDIAKLDAPVSTKTPEQQALLSVVGMTALSSEERATTINRMEQTVQEQIKVAEQVTETIHHTIDNRMNELSFNQPEIMVSSGVGVAAGDEAKRKLQGVWARGIYGVSKQRPDKGSAGYNGNSAGGTIGGDFELNEKNIVGIAYSNIRSSFKYKQSRAGDKTTGNSHILSLYGAHQLNDNWSLKTMLAAGMSKITTKRLIMDKIATGKVKNKSYSAEASLNYKIIASENLYFMPNVGLRYAHYKDGAYSERGVGVYNVSVAAKSNNTLTAITGINMIMPQKLSEALVVVPSVHVAVESYLLNKKQKVKAKLAWMDSYFENNASLGAKSAKFSYNVGGGIVAKYNNIEVSANYNCNFRKKYQNHQGTVKLKILF